MKSLYYLDITISDTIITILDIIIEYYITILLWIFRWATPSELYAIYPYVFVCNSFQFRE